MDEKYQDETLDRATKRRHRKLVEELAKILAEYDDED
jgi:hypothetical protein